MNYKENEDHIELDDLDSRLFDCADVLDISHNGEEVQSQLATGLVDKIYRRPEGPEISIRNAPIGS